MWHEMQEVVQEKSQATEVKSVLVSEDTAPTPWPETSAARADQQRSQHSRISCEQGDPMGSGHCLSASDPFTPSDPLPDTTGIILG